MKFYGVCPASCGEFVQGVLDNEEYLSSYAINLFSVATLEEGKEVIHTGPRKSRRAMELVFEKFNIPVEESKKISLNINSQIPVGKGMASSTADIGATIKATLSMLGKSLTGEEISKLAVKIEATDSLLLNRHSIFNPLTGIGLGTVSVWDGKNCSFDIGVFKFWPLFGTLLKLSVVDINLFCSGSHRLPLKFIGLLLILPFWIGASTDGKEKLGISLVVNVFTGIALLIGAGATSGVALSSTLGFAGSKTLVFSTLGIDVATKGCDGLAGAKLPYLLSNSKFNPFKVS